MRKALRFAAFLAAVLILVISCPVVYAAEEGLALADGTDSVTVSNYNSVKIFSGFTVGETFAGIPRLFRDSDRIGFVDMGDKELITDAYATVYSGALICLFDNETIADMGFMSVFGDVNGDGKISTADARLALRRASAVEKLGAVSFAAADVDLSGKVNSTDARRILRAAARLAEIENPIGSVTDASVPVEIYAYYTGDDPEAGTMLDKGAIRVVAVYSDARSAVVSSGFSVYPESLTSLSAGRQTFTVSWKELTADFTVNFTKVTPKSFYPDSRVPDYTGCTGVSALEANFYLEYITYTYPALDDMTDLVRFNTYLNYLEQCGFERVTIQRDSEKILAGYRNLAENAQTVIIYDFVGKRIYVAVYK
ncbi:MAG: dockerin type I repeat-containing protein [Clostridia bacterium]|nr:dockerin type I repeat-containing protein [Clostridia bacterium]